MANFRCIFEPYYSLIDILSSISNLFCAMRNLCITTRRQPNSQFSVFQTATNHIAKPIVPHFHSRTPSFKKESLTCR
ncbi:hypothetical protein EYC84_010313 [Monilinia fructicola]|uniref:Uncharacterized protein n=1 Tax=Monilinia fructicola TaxID=38448 RepID=A0A5M9JH31_MONFR|nr:hypothetical protein EYC84_010313 [Monilinia fructicola]